MEADQEKRKAELLKILQGVERKQPSVNSDQELLTQCQSKDRQTSRTAFKQLSQRYQNQVYTYVSHMLQDEPAAFETTRDVFVQAYKTLAHVRPDIAINAWLLKLAKRQVLKASLKRGKWSGVLLLVRVYQWYQRIVESPEQPAAISESAQTACTDIRRRLSAYHDGELSVTETTEVETHLETCEQCRLESEQLLEAIDLVHAFGRRTAPANLFQAITAALEQAPLWERLLSYLKEFMGNFSFSLPQLAAVAATVALIGLGVFSYYQHQTIQDLTTQLRSPVRGIDNAGSEIKQKTFVIFTGKIVSEGLPLEAGEYVASLIPDPEKAPKPLFIPGNITDVGDQIETYIRALQGKVTEELLQKQTLMIRKITAELPHNTTSSLALFLRTLAQKDSEPPEFPEIPPISIQFYLIDQR